MPVLVEDGAETVASADVEAGGARSFSAFGRR